MVKCLILINIFLITSVVCQKSCIQSCVRKIADGLDVDKLLTPIEDLHQGEAYDQLLQLIYSPTQTDSQNRETYSTICRGYASFRECITKCHATDQSRIAISDLSRTLNSFSTICVYFRNVFLSNMDCLTASTKVLTQTCVVDKFQPESHNSQRERIDKMTSHCRSYSRLLDCVSVNVNAQCSVIAGDLAERLMIESLEATIDLMNKDAGNLQPNECKQLAERISWRMTSIEQRLQVEEQRINSADENSVRDIARSDTSHGVMLKHLAPSENRLNEISRDSEEPTKIVPTKSSSVNRTSFGGGLIVQASVQRDNAYSSSPPPHDHYLWLLFGAALPIIVHNLH